MPSPLRRWLRRGLRILGGALALLLLLGAVAIALSWRAFGHRPVGEERARVERSPQHASGHFENPEPIVNDAVGSLTGFSRTSPDVAPTAARPVAVVHPDPRALAAPPASGLRLTWLGHSTTLVEIDGVRLLTDPIWSDRASPIGSVGPQRFYPPLVALADLPPVDAVLISHDHYDHLDMPTVVALAPRAARFIVPLGVGAHLAYWGVPPARIVERDWWEEVAIPVADGAVRVVVTPSRHASGRAPWDYQRTEWASFAIVGPRHRVYYSGDTGLHEGLRAIGERLGPFDATLVEVGQYGAAWPDWHLGPERAVEAHQRVRGRLLVPVHWALFPLAMHGWTEPIERVLVAAQKAGIEVTTPRPGESIEPTSATQPPPRDRWWPSLPWHTVAEDPLTPLPR